jgi:hypothetical protein
MRSDTYKNTYSGPDHPILSEPVNILEVLDGVGFPASKMELIAYAQDHDASEEVLDQLQCIPDDIYNSLGHVNMHINDIEIIEGAENLFSSEPSSDLPQDEWSPNDEVMPR